MALSDKTRKMMLAHLGDDAKEDMSDDDLSAAHAKWGESMQQKAKTVAMSAGLGADEIEAGSDPVDVLDKAAAALIERNDALKAEGVTALSAMRERAEAAEAERDAARADAGTAQATLAASATPRVPDPAMVAVVKDSADLIREQCVSQGVVNQGTADAIDALMFDGDNATAVFALSASPATGNRPRRTAFWRTVLAAGAIAPAGSGQKSAVFMSAGIPPTNPAAPGQPAPNGPVSQDDVKRMLGTIGLTPTVGIGK